VRADRRSKQDGHGVTARTGIRCAIYTRKSTDEGLDQAFNTLDAQREAAESFIKSQRREGWVALPQSTTTADIRVPTWTGQR
jgi:site-specific DNA recombinase